MFFHNNVHDNNNPNVPAAGSAAQGPVGTGISVSGARNDTLMGNTFTHNNAWGVIFVPTPTAAARATAASATGPVASCLFDEWGLHLIGNQFGSNGGYGHPSNGDFQKVNLQSGEPGECYSGNTEIGGGSLMPATAPRRRPQRRLWQFVAHRSGSTDPSFLTRCCAMLRSRSAPVLRCVRPGRTRG